MINVCAGNYSGNIVIDKNISLIGDLYAETIIEGNDDGSELGTIHLTPGRNGVTIKAFKVIGIDSDDPAIKKAAIYLQGDQTDIVITNNIIEARGDAALMGEYNAANYGITINNNWFTGKTFIGAE
ncbi:MAG: hypothetical protein EOM13_09030, partial [Clostridia bacterium]|nr:hypothetical protein [Clostridia bacterium]